MKGHPIATVTIDDGNGRVVFDENSLREKSNWQGKQAVGSASGVEDAPGNSDLLHDMTATGWPSPKGRRRRATLAGFAGGTVIVIVFAS